MQVSTVRAGVSVQEIRALLYRAQVGLAAHEGKAIKAYEIIGSALNPAAQVTTRVLTAKTLLTPLSNEEVRVVRCLGLNYSDHAVCPSHLMSTSFTRIFAGGSKHSETGVCKYWFEHRNLLTTSPSFPVLFFKPVTSLIGPLAPVIIPRAAQPPKEHLPDYEVELVIVIGKAAKNVSEADALDYVLGYTGANDVSAKPCHFVKTTLVNIYILRYLSANTKWLFPSGASPKDLVSRYPRGFTW